MQTEPREAVAETRVVSGEKEASQLRSDFLSRVVVSASEGGAYEYGIFDKASTTKWAERFASHATDLLKESPRFRIRHITDVQPENREAVEVLMRAGFDVKHLEGNKIRFSVSQKEYVETIHSKAGEATDQVLWSNDPQLIAQGTRIFEALWEQATPADSRMAEWQAGVKPSVTYLIPDPKQVKEKMRSMTAAANGEILLLLPTARAFHREEGIGVIDLIESAARRDVNVTILSPVDSDVLRRVDRMNRAAMENERRPIDFGAIPEARAQGTVTVLVVDHEASLIIEQKSPEENEFLKAIGMAIYSTSGPTVHAGIRFVERVREVITMAMREEGMLQKEKRDRGQAELLQDILTHDIRNFNQISLSSAEVLRERAGPEDAALIDNIIRATEGSSALIDRTKQLSKIISMDETPLVAVHLEDSIRRSLSIVEKARPDKTMVIASPLESRSDVLADDLLDEVFTNLVSNAVKYTEGLRVVLEIKIDEGAAPNTRISRGRARYLRICVTDHGRGIPDSMKHEVFRRYQDTDSGNGLGLSIVHALVVDRYHGSIRVTDRVPDNYSLGVNVEIWLRKA